ncbi:hypothetical protein K439DRAFT_1631670 [Ramaria rubella]|nr:hypothetical protein K439DRAFT_1631670 [Ramaria rubella]
MWVIALAFRTNTSDQSLHTLLLTLVLIWPPHAIHVNKHSAVAVAEKVQAGVKPILVRVVPVLSGCSVICAGDSNLFGGSTMTVRPQFMAKCH